MSPEHIIAMISSKRASDRWVAAREIAIDPTAVDRDIIEAACHAETIPQLKQRLEAALASLGVSSVPNVEPPAGEAKAIYDEAYLQSLRHLTNTVLHQVNPLIGDIERWASTEIDDYEKSNTKKVLAQLKLQSEAIAKMHNAAKPPVIEELDLSALIRDCLPNDLEPHRCLISFAGTVPLLVQGDPSLLSVAVTNGLRNAIEACLPVATEDHKPAIIINWGATDRDYWISILDEGVGFHGKISGAFEIGTSTKGHSGHGLPNIRSAMLSLSGTADLIPQNEKGCALHLTWPVINATK